MSNDRCLLLEETERRNGRHEGLIAATKAICGSCKKSRDIEFVEQINQWHHRWPDGTTTQCCADPIQKLLVSEGWTV